MSRRFLLIRSNSRFYFAAAAMASLVLSCTAGAQEPAGRAGGPVLSQNAQRSGVITRHMPIQPNLPHDPDRDDFYQTRRGDQPVTRPNWINTSGLYGLPLKGDCTVSFSPYFNGTPGGQGAGGGGANSSGSSAGNGGNAGTNTGAGGGAGGSSASGTAGAGGNGGSGFVIVSYIGTN